MQSPEGVAKALTDCINQSLEGCGKKLSDVAAIGYVSSSQFPHCLFGVFGIRVGSLASVGLACKIDVDRVAGVSFLSPCNGANREWTP